MRPLLVLLFARLTKPQDVTAIAKEAIEEICGLWPLNARGTRGCDGLLRAPIVAGAGLRDDGRLARRVRDAVLRRKVLTIALFSDSITAGHGNFYNQSFAVQLEELLGPALRKVGAALVVENFAVGNIGEFPFSAGCIASRLGDLKPDIVTWNWELYNDALCEQEHFLHAIQMIASRPILLSLQGHSLPTLPPEKHTEPQKTFREAQSRKYWRAGTRPRLAPRYFLGEAYVAKSDEALFAHGRHGWRSYAKSPIALDAALTQSAAAVVHFALAPRRSATAWGADASAWWNARGMAVNFLWHPGPVAHLLIASQIATWLLDALVAPPGAGAWPDVRPLRPRCGRPPAFCATEVKRSRGPALAALASGWDRMEDAVEEDYRSFWHGNTPGFADGLDEKGALVGDKRSGDLVLALTAQMPGRALLLCEHRCSSGGCEKHRAFMSFGPKFAYPATISGTLGEGERTLTFRERRAARSYQFDGRGPRYSERERAEWFSGRKREFTSDVSVAVGGVRVPHEVLAALQGEREAICRDCPNFREACLVVAANLTAGDHRVAVWVTPRSIRDPAAHVAVAAVILA